MPLKPEASRQADKFLTRLMRSNLKRAQQVIAKIEALCEQPIPPDSLLLKGFEPWRRADSGEYRIIYAVEGEVLRVRAVGRRNDDAIYRLLRRLD